MYYSKISNPGSGFTNQIFSLITSILIAYRKGEKIIVVDDFLNDIHKTTYTPISNIFDISAINIFLKKNYDMIIVDKNTINFNLVSVQYGTNKSNYLNLTNYIKTQYIQNNKLIIDKNCVLNDIQGDPCFGQPKHLIVTYTINEFTIQEQYNENLPCNIEINTDGPYLFTFGWINSIHTSMFEHILKNISYHSDFTIKSSLLLNTINHNKKKNVIHLRLEEDGIAHWSLQNNMTPIQYKIYLENKYIQLIQKYISCDDETIIVSSSLSNTVIDFLESNNYNYRWMDKYFKDREKDAIIDLLVSKCCNNIFISNFNIKNCNGSSFSYYIWKCLEDATTIYIDVDRIYDKEVIYKIESQNLCL